MSQQWSHAERLSRLLEAAVLNSEEFTFKTSHALAYMYDMEGEEVEDKELKIMRLQEEAISHLEHRSLAMTELNRIFELFGQLEGLLHSPQMGFSVLQVVQLEPILARIDERLRCPGCRS